MFLSNKKNIFLFSLLTLMFQSVNAAPDFCPANLPEKMASMKPLIKNLTWLDINPQENGENCQFIMRYYPCNADIQEKIDALLPQIIKENFPECTLLDSGASERIEGYCGLNHVKLHCLSTIIHGSSG